MALSIYAARPRFLEQSGPRKSLRMIPLGESPQLIPTEQFRSQAIKREEEKIYGEPGGIVSKKRDTTFVKGEILSERMILTPEEKTFRGVSPTAFQTISPRRRLVLSPRTLPPRTESSRSNSPITIPSPRREKETVSASSVFANSSVMGEGDITTSPAAPSFPSASPRFHRKVYAQSSASSLPLTSPSSSPRLTQIKRTGTPVSHDFPRLPTIPLEQNENFAPEEITSSFVPSTKEASNTPRNEAFSATAETSNNAIAIAHSPISWKRSALKRRPLSPRQTANSGKNRESEEDTTIRNPLHPKHGPPPTVEISFEKKTVLYKFIPKQMYPLSTFADTGCHFEAVFCGNKHLKPVQMKKKLQTELRAKEVKFRSLAVREEDPVDNEYLQEVNPNLLFEEEETYYVYRVTLLLV